jgi:PAS domain S-box-containing protein
MRHHPALCSIPALDAVLVGSADLGRSPIIPGLVDSCSALAMPPAIYGWLAGLVVLGVVWWSLQRDRHLRQQMQQQLRDRQQIEASLGDRNQKLSLALRVAKAGMWQWDIATHQVTWSTENYRLLGYDPNTVEPSYEQWLQTVHPEDRAWVAQAVQNAVATHQGLALEFRIIRPDGSLRWLADMGDVVHDDAGQLIGMVGVQIDITDRKEAELRIQQLNQDLEQRVAQRTAELERSKSQLQRLAANMPGIIYQYVSRSDGTDQFLYVSPGCQDLYGFEAQDLEQNPALAWNSVHPDDLASIQSSIHAAIQTLNPWVWEGRIITTAGETKWLQCSSRPELQPNGDILWDGLMMDITDRKQAQESLQESEARFRNMAMNVPGALFRYLLRPDGTDAVLYMSPGCYGLWEVEAEVAVQSASTLWEVVHPEDLPKMYESVMESARTLEPWSHTWRITTKSGKQKWLEAAGRPERQPNGDIIWDTLILDVSDRKYAEQAVREHVRRLTTLLSNLPGAVYRVQNDRHYTVEFMSDGILPLTGYSSAEFLNGDITPGQLVHPDDGETIWQTIQTAIAQHRSYEYEYRLMTRSGEQRWVWERGQGVYDEAGELQGLEGFITDVTARHQTEDELHQVLDTNQAILHAIPDLILRVTRDGIYQDVIPGDSIPLTAPIDQVIGHHLKEVLPDEVAQQRLTLIEQAFQTGTAQIHEYELIINGETHYEESRTVVCSDHEALILVRDITERKQAEAALRESEERLRLAVMAASQGLYDLDLTTGIAIVSPEYATMLGYEPAEFQETHERWLDRLHPEDRSPTRQAFLDYIAGARSDYTLEFRQRHRDGHWVWTLSVGEVVTWDETGRPLRMLGIHTDITDRKLAERERDRMIAILEASTDFIGMTDPDGHVLWINAQARQYVQGVLQPTDVSHLSIADCHPQWATQLIFGQGVPTAVQQGSWLGETALLTHDGGEIPVSQLIISHKSNEGEVEYLSTILRDMTDVKQREQALRDAGEALQQQSQRSQLFAQVALKVRQSIDLDEILYTTVTETQAILQSDRVLVCRITEGHQMVLQAAASQTCTCKSGQSIIDDPSLSRLLPTSSPGQIQAIADVEAADLSPPHQVWLQDLGVRAYVTVPLLQADQVWGMLVVHQCDRPRIWQDFELDFLAQLADQVSIALAQAQLVTDLRHSQQSLQQLNQELEARVEQRTAALRHSEAQLLEAQRVAHLGSWELDIATGHVTWSPELFAIFGMDVKPEAPSYIEQQALFAPEDWLRLNALLEHSIHTGEPYATDLKIYRSDGSIGYVFAKGQPDGTRSDPITRLTGIAMDISDRKAVEQALAASEQRYKTLAATVPVAIYRYDTNGQCIYVNPYWSKMTGRPQSEALGNGWIRAIHPDDRDRLQKEAEYNLQRSQAVEVEGRHLRTDGSVNWFYSQMLPELGPDGQLIGYVGTLTDITARKQAEQGLQQTAAQLEAANQELESFSYSVSHDLRAPLRHMNGFVHALKQRLQTHAALEDPKVTHYLQVIETSSQKMSLLIDGLLTLSRIGRKPLSTRPVNLRALVDDAIALTQDQRSPDTTVEFRIGTLPIVQGDAVLLQQVLSNLISNAVKFSRTCANPVVEVGCLNEHTCFVRDNGVGFQMEYADKLFGAFQRLHAQTDFEGTGIGLAIVQRIIHRHGGRVWADSQPNQGATFYFSLGTALPSNTSAPDRSPEDNG